MFLTNKCQPSPIFYTKICRRDYQFYIAVNRVECSRFPDFVETKLKYQYPKWGIVSSLSAGWNVFELCRLFPEAYIHSLLFCCVCFYGYPLDSYSEMEDFIIWLNGGSLYYFHLLINTWPVRHRSSLFEVVLSQGALVIRVRQVAWSLWRTELFCMLYISRREHWRRTISTWCWWR